MHSRYPVPALNDRALLGGRAAGLRVRQASAVELQDELVGVRHVPALRSRRWQARTAPCPPRPGRRAARRGGRAAPTPARGAGGSPGSGRRPGRRASRAPASAASGPAPPRVRAPGACAAPRRRSPAPARARQRQVASARELAHVAQVGRRRVPVPMAAHDGRERPPEPVTRRLGGLPALVEQPVRFAPAKRLTSTRKCWARSFEPSSRAVSIVACGSSFVISACACWPARRPGRRRRPRAARGPPAPLARRPIARPRTSRTRALADAASPTASTRSRSRGRRCARAWTRCRRRTWTGPSSTCGCSSITASGSSARAWRSTTRCNGICTTSGPSSSCRAARCSTATGARASRAGSRGPSRRCASASPATSCAASAS